MKNVLCASQSSEQANGAVKITSVTFDNSENTTVMDGITNTLRIDYQIIDKNKLHAGDTITIQLPDIFKDITPDYPKKHFSDCVVNGNLLTLTFKDNIGDKTRLQGYIVISLTGNSNIKNKEYPITINLYDTTKTIYVSGKERSGDTSQTSPIMYKGAFLSRDSSGLGIISNMKDNIKYYVEINRDKRPDLKNSIFLDNIPKGMELLIDSIHLTKIDYYDQRTDVTKEFFDSGKIKATKNSIKIDFGMINYEQYSLRYSTKIVSTEAKYTNSAHFYYNNSKYDTDYTAKPSSKSGAIDVIKSVSKTVVNNNGDQNIQYKIKFDSDGYFAKGSMHIRDPLDPRLSDIKISQTGHFSIKYDKTTNEINIVNDKNDIQKGEDAYITIDASMKNVKPGESVSNIAYVNEIPTNEVITKKTPEVSIKKIAAGDKDERILSGAVFKLTTYDNKPVIDVYGKQIDEITTISNKPISLELPYGHYKLIEKTPPNGYKLNKNPKYFLVNDSSKVVTVIFEDESLPPQCDLMIKKVNENNIPLLGAEFKLVKQDDSENALKFISKQNKNNYEINNNGTICLKPIGEDSYFSINNLPYGNYILKEIKSPNGYKLSPDIYITLTSKESFYKVGKEGQVLPLIKNTKTNSYSITVKDMPRIILPETGASGTFKFYLIGNLLLVITVILLASNKLIIRNKEN